MRVAIYVPVAHRDPEYVRAISGHVQVPLRTIALLQEAGHEVTLLTTRPRPGHQLPPLIPPQTAVVTFADASPVWPATRRRPIAAALQVSGLLAHLVRGRYDVVHFFGHSNTMVVAGAIGLVLKALGRRTVMATTFDAPSSVARRVFGLAPSAVSAGLADIVALTSYSATQWESLLDRPVAIAYPGVLKNMAVGADATVSTAKSVLFWRNASRNNGADLAQKLFAALAPDYPDVRFRFAVRPHDELEDSLRECADLHDNIELHVYPYGSGVTVQALIAASSCCVFPFRRLSINPQYSILETLAAGVPIVCSGVESNAEVVRDGTSGYVVHSESVDDYARHVSRILDDDALRQRLGRGAADSIRDQWQWSRYATSLLRTYANIC